MGGCGYEEEGEEEEEEDVRRKGHVAGVVRGLRGARK